VDRRVALSDALKMKPEDRLGQGVQAPVKLHPGVGKAPVGRRPSGVVFPEKSFLARNERGCVVPPKFFGGPRLGPARFFGHAETVHHSAG
jgi:hypothetical protein